MSTQVSPLAVAPIDVVTLDNVPARVEAVVYLRVTDPVKAVVEVQDYRVATSQVMQAALRWRLGEIRLDDLLHRQAAVNRELAEIMNERTAPWGVDVVQAEITEVELPEALRDAMVRPSRSVAPPADDEYL